VALGCIRFKGKHSYDIIAAAIHQILARYGIEDKVVKTCTDNASNMIKAFSSFQKRDDDIEESDQCTINAF